MTPTTKHLELADSLTALATKYPAEEQFSTAQEAAKALFTDYARKCMEVHELETKLFQLKLLNEVMTDPAARVHRVIEARLENKALFDTVIKPEGVPIKIFQAASPDNAKIMENFIKDLQSGKIVLS